MTQKLIKLYQETSPLQKIQGEYWYTQARLFCLMIAIKYGFSMEQVAAVVSLLSPRNKWTYNKQDAENLIKAYKLGLPKDSISSHTFKLNVTKALESLSGENPRFGQKTQSFYNCIVDSQTGDVCIDVWAARAVGYKKRVIYPRVYREIQAKYKKAATELEIPPHVLQATVWLKVREDAHSRTKQV